VLEIGQDGTMFEFMMKVGHGEHWIAASYLNQFDGLPANFGGLNPRPSNEALAITQQRPAGAQAGGATQNQQRLVASLNAKCPVDYLYAADSIILKWFEVVRLFHAVGGASLESK